MPGLPKSYIKKYGISKRAWREYRASSGGKRKRKVKSRSNPSKRRGNPRMPAKKKSRRRRTRNLGQSDLAIGIAKVASRAVSRLIPVTLPFDLQQDIILYGMGKFGRLPKAKTVATADAVDKVVSTFIGGVNVQGFGGFTGEDWI